MRGAGHIEAQREAPQAEPAPVLRNWPELLATSAAFLATLALILWGPLGL